jgi:hypothetical protein
VSTIVVAIQYALQDMRDVDLNAIGFRADEAINEVKLLKAIVRSTPREIGGAVQPMLDTLRDQVEHFAVPLQASSVAVAAHVQQVSGRLDCLAEHQVASTRALGEQLHASIQHHSDSLQAGATVTHEQINQKIVALEASMAATRHILAQQATLFDALRHDQHGTAERAAAQLQKATQTLQISISVAVGVLCLAAAGTAYFLVDKF